MGGKPAAYIAVRIIYVKSKLLPTVITGEAYMKTCLIHQKLRYMQLMQYYIQHDNKTLTSLNYTWNHVYSQTAIQAVLNADISELWCNATMQDIFWNRLHDLIFLKSPIIYKTPQTTKQHCFKTAGPYKTASLSLGLFSSPVPASHLTKLHCHPISCFKSLPPVLSASNTLPNH